jgi:hypothetical protein
VHTYVSEIEPRLTPHRPARPETVADTLIEACRDLEQETLARLSRIPAKDLYWQPHPDANSVGVTVWHIARWLDFLGTRAFTGRPAEADRWHTSGWADRTGYEPDGVGWLGLGSLTGYTPAEMRAVPQLEADHLSTYLSEATAELVETLGQLRDHLHVGGTPTPYQAISSTLQGSFGHVGEIDALVSLRARLADDTAFLGRSAHPTAAGPDDTQTPIACSLGAEEMATRVADWQATLADVRTRTPLPNGGLRLELKAAADLGPLARLIADEQRCCPFLAFTLTVDHRGSALEVRAPDVPSSTVPDA